MKKFHSIFLLISITLSLNFVFYKASAATLEDKAPTCNWENEASARSLQQALKKLQFDGTLDDQKLLFKEAHAVLEGKHLSEASALKLIDTIFKSVRMINPRLKPLHNPTNDQIIKERVNYKAYSREALLYVMLTLMERYKGAIPKEKMNTLLAGLADIAKLDYLSHARRLAMLGYAAFEKDKHKVKKLLHHMKETDGDIVLDAFYSTDYRGQDKFEYPLKSNRNADGKLTFKTKLPSKSTYIMNLFLKGRFQHEITGTKEEIKKLRTERLIEINKLITTLKNPKDSLTKKILSEELEALNERLDFWGSNSRVAIENEKKIAELKSSQIPLDTIRELEKDRKLLETPFKGKTYINGVTRYLAENTKKVLIPELEKKIENGEKISFSEIHSKWSEMDYKTTPYLHDKYDHEYELRMNKF